MAQHFAQQNDDNLSYFFGSAWRSERRGLDCEHDAAKPSHFDAWIFCDLVFFLCNRLDCFLCADLTGEQSKTDTSPFFTALFVRYQVIRTTKYGKLKNWDRTPSNGRIHKFFTPFFRLRFEAAKTMFALLSCVRLLTAHTFSAVEHWFIWRKPRYGFCNGIAQVLIEDYYTRNWFSVGAIWIFHSEEFFFRSFILSTFFLLNLNLNLVKHTLWILCVPIFIWNKQRFSQQLDSTVNPSLIFNVNIFQKQNWLIPISQRCIWKMDWYVLYEQTCRFSIAPSVIRLPNIWPENELSVTLPVATPDRKHWKAVV